MMVGGGSGGHVTPLLAVATALKKKQPNAHIAVIGQKNENLQEVVEHDAIAESFAISAGKFRRYHGESLFAHLRDVKTIVLNVRDLFRFLWGTIEAWVLLGKERPDALFLKGGFVCVPVGFAAHLRGIPYITHDSDAIPGLANRITGRFARFNTTALPAELYPYAPEKAVQVGIPLREEFTYVDAVELPAFKSEIEVDTDAQVLLCMGGGLGAQKLNKALAKASSDLLSTFPNLVILHVSGQKLYDQTLELYQKVLSDELRRRVRVYAFHNDLYKLSGAADVIVSRAGATSIAEFAIQSKACVIVPNPVLTGGQQIHNGRALTQAEAALVVDEDDAAGIESAIHELLKSEEKRKMLAERLHRLAYPDSAEKIADILVSLCKKTT